MAFNFLNRIFSQQPEVDEEEGNDFENESIP